MTAVPSITLNNGVSDAGTRSGCLPDAAAGDDRSGAGGAIGVSNFMVEHLTSLLEKATVVPAVNQIELHPYFQQREVQASDAEHGILTQAWSPIGGITFYRDGSHGSTLEDPVIGEIAEAHGKSPAQVMLRWHLQQGRSVSPSRPSRTARENFDVFDFDLTRRRAGRDRRPGHRPARRPRAGRHHPGDLRPRRSPRPDATPASTADNPTPAGELALAGGRIRSHDLRLAIACLVVIGGTAPRCRCGHPAIGTDLCGIPAARNRCRPGYPCTGARR